MKKLLSLLIVLTLIVSVFAITAINTPASGASQYAQTSTPVEGGNVLHCMCWSYNTIKANLDDIKAAGYTAVQTSCIQPLKDYSAYNNNFSDWWKFYQPIDICVADSGQTWLGSKAELIELTTAAHQKGIKIISDIVVNHMGNGSSGSGKSSQINPTLLNDSACWHNKNQSQTGQSHYDMTQYDVSNCPDLNTANKTVQNMVLALLKEAVDCGVDGFRFDAAQNIEVPEETDNVMGAFGSDFWPTVMNGVKSYASSKGKSLYAYGEMYYDAWGTIDKYLSYIGHVSEPISGIDALVGARDGYASDVADITYQNYREAKYNMIWVESHDSYFHGTGTDHNRTAFQTSTVSNTVLNRAWAITGSRNAATALFFARPNTKMGVASSDTNWKSTTVAEVNKFKNYFRGQSEYMSSSGKCAYNERGTSGVVISKLDGAGSVSLTAHKMASGTYKDQITGNTFTVSGGKITGTVGDTGVAVVYNPSNTSMTEAPSSGKILTLKPGVWNTDNAWFAAYFYGNGEQWVKMSGSGSTYTVDAPVGFSNVIFVRMSKDDTSTLSWDNKWNQTADLTVPASNATYTISGWGSDTDICPGTWSVDPTSAPATSASTPTTSNPTVAPSTAPTNSSYYLVGSMTSWKPDPAYNFFSYNSDSGTEQYKLTVYLNSGVTCKAVKSADGSTIDAWYPDGGNNDISITSAGWYSFYLRPKGDGNSDWIASGNDSSKKVIYYKPVSAPATEAPTAAPTQAPTDAPTAAPTQTPTVAPTTPPMTAPTEASTLPYDPDTQYLLGDADGDGIISIMDATNIQQMVAGYTLPDSERMAIRSSITSDSYGILDATVIQRYLAQYDDGYDIGNIKTY